MNRKPNYSWIQLLTVLVSIGWVVSFGSCTERTEKAVEASAVKPCEIKPSYAREILPEGISWLSNNTDPVFASPQARQGGTYHAALASFPLTFRVVGPDSNSSFRSAILGNQLSLIGIHPNTRNIIPELATHWAFGPDKKTMFFKLKPRAGWSDGQSLTADDFVYTLEFMRSRHIVAPWYNDFYSREIERVVVYDDYTLAVVGHKAQPDLHLKLAIGPTPRHYYCELDEGFVRDYNWRIAPNTGPYQMSRFKKGRYIVFERKQDWWARDQRYFKNRFNVDRVRYSVIRDVNLQWEYFLKAQLDHFGLTMPQFWHIKSRTPVIEKGYVERIWFLNDTPQSAQGLWLNLDRDIFKDLHRREAFAHAMNIQKVIETVLRNDYFRLESAYVGYGPYSNNAIKARRFSLVEVDRLMQAAGWQRAPDGIWQKNGQRYSVEVSYSREEHTPRLVVLKEEARKAGIELRLQRLDPAAQYKKILEKRHDVGWLGWSTGMRPHFWEFWHSVNAHRPQTNNVSNADDPELDRLIDRYRDSLDENERIELAWEIQARVHALGAFVPTFMVPYFREAYWRWWRFPDPPATRLSDSLFDPFSSSTGGLFWFDQDLYRETREAMRKGIVFDPVTIKNETFKIGL
ncbi:MAG: ABC transporter substrate-binding protein [Desulfosarcina sp.]|nr:ABC transporter substrate-binding protein [Desulfobacterales bacterium]